MSAKPGNLQPHLLRVAVREPLLHALVEGHLVPHPTPDLVHPEIVPVAQEVVVRDEPVERLPHHIDVNRPDPLRARHAEPVKVDVGKVAVVDRRPLLPPSRDVLPEKDLVRHGEHVLRPRNVQQEDVEPVGLGQLVGEVHQGRGGRLRDAVVDQDLGGRGRLRDGGVEGSEIGLEVAEEENEGEEGDDDHEVGPRHGASEEVQGCGHGAECGGGLKANSRGVRWLGRLFSHW